MELGGSIGCLDADQEIPQDPDRRLSRPSTKGTLNRACGQNWEAEE